MVHGGVVRIRSKLGNDGEQLGSWSKWAKRRRYGEKEGAEVYVIQLQRLVYCVLAGP